MKVDSQISKISVGFSGGRVWSESRLKSVTSLPYPRQVGEGVNHEVSA